MSYSYDADCANTVIGYGYPVDSCIMDVGYAIKFQLIQGIVTSDFFLENNFIFEKYICATDSCIGGIVEYFRDEECTMLAGTSDLDGFNNACSVAEQSLLGDSETSYAKLQCTTNAVPTVAMDSGILEYVTAYMF